MTIEERIERKLDALLLHQNAQNTILVDIYANTAKSPSDPRVAEQTAKLDAINKNLAAALAANPVPK